MTNSRRLVPGPDHGAFSALARSVVTAAAFAAMGLVPAVASTAQQSPTPAFQAVLRVGDDVRLAAPGVFIDEASVTRVTADSLVVVRAGQQWSLDARAIQRLYVRRKQTGRWAQRGAIGGFGMGIVSNVFASGLCDTCGTSSLLAAAAGATIVGALGAAIGSRNFRWEAIVGGGN